MSDTSDFNFCWEHSGRTCCNVEDVQKIRTKIALAKSRSTGNDDNNISDQCLSMSVRASCAVCDGDLVSNQFFHDDFYRVLVNQMDYVSIFAMSGTFHA